MPSQPSPATGGIPIVFIHGGNSAYLPATLLQARITAPAHRRVLLGDGGSAHLGALVEHVDTAPYRHRAEKLGQVFVNLSTNPPLFELLCLQRWLMLLAWMEAQGLEQCLYLDSDVMLYNTPEQLATYMPPGAAMSVSGISGHTNLVLDRTALAAFCGHIQAAYTTTEGQAGLRAEYAAFSAKHAAGGISDMSFFSSFRAAHPGLVADLQALPDGSAVDVTIDYAQGMRMEHGLKAITLRPQPSGPALPYATHEGGTQARMHTLHFQGASKAYIQQYYSGPKLTLLLWTAWNNLYLYGQKAMRRLGR